MASAGKDQRITVKLKGEGGGLSLPHRLHYGGILRIVPVPISLQLFLSSYEHQNAPVIHWDGDDFYMLLHFFEFQKVFIASQ